MLNKPLSLIIRNRVYLFQTMMTTATTIITIGIVTPTARPVVWDVDQCDDLLSDQ